MARVTNTTYTLSAIKENYEKKKFMIPKYQRGYKWNPQKRDDLIDSILKKYPIGAIIIWRHEDIDYILDGQQRTRSLLKIREKPFSDMSEETFFLHFINKKLSKIEIQKFRKTKILQTLRDKKIEDLFAKEKYKENGYIMKLIMDKENPLLELGVDNEVLTKKLKTYVDDFYNGNFLSIPAIEIYDSNEEDAIEIFSRLNSKGIALTKIEKLAAKWSNKIIEIHNKELLQMISNIYEIDDSKDVRDTNKNTPLELIQAILLKSFDGTDFLKKTFVEEKKGISFLKSNHIEQLLWIFRVMIIKENGKEVKGNLLDDDKTDVKMGQEIFDIVAKDEERVIVLGNLLNNAWKQMEEKCKIILKKHNSKYIFSSISVNLLISMASQILIKLIDDKNYKAPDFLQLVLIKEIINGSYMSSTTTVVKQTIENNEYLKEALLTDVKVKLIEANDSQKNEYNKKKGFHKISKLVISIVYSSYSENKSPNFDYDHIMPKQFLKINNLSKGQNSIGNCGILTSSINRGKKDDVDIENLLNDKLVEISDIDKSSYRDLISKIRDEKRYEDFVKLLDRRFEVILEIFLDKIDPKPK